MKRAASSTDRVDKRLKVLDESQAEAPATTFRKSESADTNSLDSASFVIDELISDAFPDMARSSVTHHREAAIRILTTSEDQADTLMMDLFNYSDPELVSAIINFWQTSSSKASQQGEIYVEIADLYKDQRRRMAESVEFHSAGNKVFETKTEAYDEIVVEPTPRPLSSIDLVKIESLPNWAQPVFAGYKTLNPVQSKVFPVVFGDFRQNILMCAPTGAGKTNVAILTILNALYTFGNPDIPESLISVKTVYIAPMKALVQEVVQNLRQRFSSIGITVEELSGDSSLSMNQLEKTHVIVSTPEKWDVVTRKQNPIVGMVKLIIIDEVHLLNDSRGPVIEAIVARTFKRADLFGLQTRVVGLSATLPNYPDVAQFLRVSPGGLFFFGPEYRPVSLKQTFVGVSETTSLKKLSVMTQLVCKNISDAVEHKQIIVFVHSRQDTYKTAQDIRDYAIQNNLLPKFLGKDPASQQILKDEAPKRHSSELRDLLTYSIGIHHAGLSRSDRTSVEELFADNHLQVIVSTLTLAWGVNLPAHTVIIKGTEVYSPSDGDWVSLSSMDMLQMIGRAGRPQYDSEGHGIVITSRKDLPFYLSIMNTQYELNSQILSCLPELLNSEIVSGMIRNLTDCVDWLNLTFFAVRFALQPSFYGHSGSLEPSTLNQFKRSLCYSALIYLDKLGMIQYDGKSESISVNFLGKVGSHFYLRTSTVNSFNRLIQNGMQLANLVDVLATSDEFQSIRLREEERQEVYKLCESIPLPLARPIDSDSRSAKISALLQSFISRTTLDSSSLSADTVFIEQNAGRLLRAVFELCRNRGWSSLALKCLALSKMVSQRTWEVQCPLRQLKHGVPVEVFSRLEKRGISWEELCELDPSEIGDIIKAPKLSKIIERLISQLPQPRISASVQPLSKSCLNICIDVQLQGRHSQELFWIFIIDPISQKLLYDAKVLVNDAGLSIEVCVPVLTPMSTYYSIKLISDRWVVPETSLSVSLDKLCLPQSQAGMETLLKTEADTTVHPSIMGILDKFGMKGLNPFQLACLPLLIDTEHSLIACPAGCGRSVLLALMTVLHILSDPHARCILISPRESDSEGSRIVLEPIMKQFGISVSGHLHSEDSRLVLTDCRTLFRHLSVNSGGALFSRSSLFIFNQLEAIENTGSLLESLVQSTFRICKRIGRVVGFGWLSNIDDVRSWLKIKKEKTLFFGMSSRNSLLSVNLCEVDNTQRGDIAHKIQHESNGMNGPVVIFVSDKSMQPDILRSMVQRGIPVENILSIWAEASFSNTETIMATPFILINDVRQCPPGFCLKSLIIVESGRQGHTIRRDDLYRVLRLLPNIDPKLSILVDSRRKAYWECLLNDAVNLESGLDLRMDDHILTVSYLDKLSTFDEMLSHLAETFLARRMISNPNFYSLTNATQFSSCLSDWLETSASRLVEKGYFTAESGHFKLTELARASVLSAVPVQIISFLEVTVNPNLKKKGIIALLASCPDVISSTGISIDLFVETLDKYLSRSAEVSLITLDSVSFWMRLIQAVLYVAVSKQMLKVVIHAIELCSHISTRTEPGSSSLLQLPGFSVASARKASESFGISEVWEICGLPIEQRRDLYASSDCGSDAEAYCNKFPSIDFSVRSEKASGVLMVHVSLDRESDDRIDELWWLVVASSGAFSCEPVRVRKGSTTFHKELEFPESYVRVMLMSGSYRGCDQEEIIDLD